MDSQQLHTASQIVLHTSYGITYKQIITRIAADHSMIHDIITMVLKHITNSKIIMEMGDFNLFELYQDSNILYNSYIPQQLSLLQRKW